MMQRFYNRKISVVQFNVFSYDSYSHRFAAFAVLLALHQSFPALEVTFALLQAELLTYYRIQLLFVHKKRNLIERVTIVVVYYAVCLNITE